MSARLRTAIPLPRLAPDETAVQGTGVDAVDRYQWNRLAECPLPAPAAAERLRLGNAVSV